MYHYVHKCTFSNVKLHEKQNFFFFFFLVTLENFCSASCLIQLSGDNPRSMKVNEEREKGGEEKEELEIKIN